MLVIGMAFITLIWLDSRPGPREREIPRKERYRRIRVTVLESWVRSAASKEVFCRTLGPEKSAPWKKAGWKC